MRSGQNDVRFVGSHPEPEAVRVGAEVNFRPANRSSREAKILRTLDTDICRQTWCDHSRTAGFDSDVGGSPGHNLLSLIVEVFQDFVGRRVGHQNPRWWRSDLPREPFLKSTARQQGQHTNRQRKQNAAARTDGSQFPDWQSCHVSPSLARVRSSIHLIVCQISSASSCAFSAA